MVAVVIEMNERILELADQCEGRTICDCGETGFNFEKFAELIVKECCQKLEDDGMVEIAIEMKQHFGVE
jgi:hypothetical protein